MDLPTPPRTFLASDESPRGSGLVATLPKSEGRSEPPPESLADWLERNVLQAEMIALSQQQTCAQLNSQWQVVHCGLARACEELEGSVTQLNFDLLHPSGWFLRIMGMDRQSRLRFLRQWHEIEAAGTRFREASRGFTESHRLRQESVKRIVLDLQLESRRLRDILDVATRCLTTLSREISVRGVGSDDVLVQLARRTEVSLEILYPVNAAMLGVLESIERSSIRSDAIIKLLDFAWTQELIKWRASMRELEESIVADEHTYERLEEHAKAHSWIRRLIIHVAASFAAFKRQEDYLLNGLATLAGEPEPEGG